MRATSRDSLPISDHLIFSIIYIIRSSDIHGHGRGTSARLIDKFRNIRKIRMPTIGSLTMTVVNATEFQRNPGLYLDKAGREPVIVTHHGRERSVILSVEEYRRLKGQTAVRRDRSPEAIAARKAQSRQIADQIAAMPILDSRPISEIMDDINAL